LKILFIGLALLAVGRRVYQYSKLGAVTIVGSNPSDIIKPLSGVGSDKCAWSHQAFSWIAADKTLMA